MTRAGLEPMERGGGRLEIFRPPGMTGVELHTGTAFAHSYPRHWHDGYYLGAITGGSAVYEIAGEARGAGPGTLVALAPGDVHAHGARGGGGARSFRTLHVETAYVAALGPELSSAAGAGALRSHVFSDARLARCFVEMHRRLGRAGTLLRRESHLLALLAELAPDPPRPHDARAPGERERAGVRRARERLDAAAGENVSLTELASLAGLSPFHFHRLFRRETGLPPHEYLVGRRILEARARLRRGEPAAAVAAAAGFADQSHLTRHFKRLLGLTPAAYARGKNVQDGARAGR